MKKLRRIYISQPFVKKADVAITFFRFETLHTIKYQNICDTISHFLSLCFLGKQLEVVMKIIVL